MKILLLCLRFPYPPNDGGTIAMYNMAMALRKAGADVHILAFNTRKHFIDPALVPETFMRDFNARMVYLDATVKPLHALANMFGSGSYNVSRFDTRLFHETLTQVLQSEQFDVIQMESLFMTPYIETIRSLTSAPVVLRSHNVEYIIWDRLAAAERNPVKKWYLHFLSGRLRNYEKQVIGKLDGIIALTAEDKKLFEALGATVPVKISPIGINTDEYPVPSTDLPPSLVHLGSMDWMPNIEAVDWFLNSIYPLLKARGMQAPVFLAGKAMPDRIFNRADSQLHVEGRIDHAREWLADKQIMIVPLLSGGGMRVKIIEGLAMGKTIISTSIGAEGIQYTNGKNMLIADSPEAFCEAVLNCINRPDYAREIGREGRRLAESVYENKILGGDILSYYDTLPKRHPESLNLSHSPGNAS